MNKKRKIVTAAITIIVIAAAVIGIGYAVKKTTGNSTVLVVEAGNLNYGGWSSGMNETQGIVTDDAEQNVYIGQNDIIDEVLVLEGDQVTEGQVLIRYDRTRTSLALQKQELAYSQVQLNIQVAERNLDTLNRITPVSESSEEEQETVPEETSEEELPDIAEEQEPVVYIILGTEAIPYNKDEAAGTAEAPYRFLCTEGCTVTASFMRYMQQFAEEGPIYFMLEVREDDKKTGALKKAWLEDAYEFTGTDEWSAVLRLDDSGSKQEEPEEEIVDVVTPEPEIPVETDDTITELTAAVIPGTGQGKASASFASFTTVIRPVYAQDSDIADLASVGLISSDAQYTKEELEAAIKAEQEKLRDYKLDLREAELKLKDARIADEQGEVCAKMDGVVKKAGSKDDTLADGLPFITVKGTGGQYVRCGISELMLEDIHEGDPVQIMSWETGMTYEAEIKDISPYPDTSGMFGYGSQITYYPFTAQILDEDAQLTNDNWVSVTIPAGSAEKEAGSDEAGSDFYLWKAFILDENGHKYVYKQGSSGLLEKQEITVGKLDGEGYKIISGVTMSDWIAFPYGKGVKEGAKTRQGTVEELYSAG